MDVQTSGCVNLTDLRIGKPGRSGPPWLRVTAGTAGLTSRSSGGVTGGVPVSGAVPGSDVEGVPGSEVEGVTAGAEGVTGSVSAAAGGDASVGVAGIVVGSAGVSVGKPTCVRRSCPCAAACFRRAITAFHSSDSTG